MKTTKANVVSQLMYEWDEDDEGTPIKGEQLMTEIQAINLLSKHESIFEHCQMMGSFAWYTANKIREAEQKAWHDLVSEG